MKIKFERITPCGLIRVALGLGLLGVTAGLSYLTAKEKYERLANERVEEIRQHYIAALVRRKEQETRKDPSVPTFTEKSPSGMTKYHGQHVTIPDAVRETLHEYGSSHNTTKRKRDDRDIDPEYVERISEQEYNGEDDDHEKHSLVYYMGDDVLIDPFDEVIDPYHDVVGRSFVDHFENDLVFVRNTRLHCDYEINYDPGSYIEKVLGMTSPEDDNETGR